MRLIIVILFQIRLSQTMTEQSSNKLVRLNVGGVIYMTTRTTLCSYPDSMLAAMFSGSMMPGIQDEEGCYFIDRNGSVFGIILDFLRSGNLYLCNDFKHFDLLAAEANFYQLSDIIEAIDKLRVNKPQKGHILEITEFRFGQEKVKKYVNNENLNFYTVVSGRGLTVDKLPDALFADNIIINTEVISQSKGDRMKFVEIEMEGAMRVRFANYLQCDGWTLMDSHLSTSSKPPGSMEDTSRDRWFLSDDTIDLPP